MSQKSRWLLCPPDFYTVHYEINPWMKKEITPNKERAIKQWNGLHSVFVKLEVPLYLIEPQNGWPDMVFTANAGLAKDKNFVLSKFRYPERQGEEPHFEAWFKNNGYKVHHLRTGAFEGEGDALFWGKRLIGGCGFRSDHSAYSEVPAMLGIDEIVTVQLINPYFYHLDTCFCPLDEQVALIYPPAFQPEDVTKLRKLGELIEVPENDAKRFACNTVVLGKDLIIPSGCSTTQQLLEARGFTTHAVELDEYLKAGGAAKCLCLRLDN